MLKTYLKTPHGKQAEVCQLSIVQDLTDPLACTWLTRPLVHPPLFLYLFLWTFQRSLAEGKQMNEETPLTCIFNDISSWGKMLCRVLVLILLMIQVIAEKSLTP